MSLIVLLIVLPLVSTAFAIRGTSVHRRHARADRRERELRTGARVVARGPGCVAEDQL